MKATESPDDLVVLDCASAFSVLLDSRQRQALLPFVRTEVTVKQAALELGELPNTMLSRVKRWQRLGLVQTTRVVPHSKGSMRLYRSRASTFFVPHAATSSEDLFALARELHAPMLEEFLRSYVRVGEQLSPDWGLHFRVSQNRWVVRPAKSANASCEPTDDASPHTLIEHQVLQLEPAQAKALQRELMATLQRYQQMSSRSGKPYQVLLGLA